MKQFRDRVAVVTGAGSGIAEQQLRWMRTGEPLRPGPGVARTADE